MMTQRQALEVVLLHRGERIVVTAMSSAGLWPQLSNSPLDFAYIPSAMGHAPSLGLGLALAQPERGVIVLNGDGCALMSLGNLVTLAHHRANIHVLILDNGIYEVTGGQPHVGAGQVDFAAIARGAGIERVYTFATLADWQAGAAEALAGVGPVVIHLKVEALMGQKTPKPPRPMAEQICRLQEARWRKLIDMNPQDEIWMCRALVLAERGRGHVEPNPLVGAVIVRDGTLVGEGWHEKFGQAHAEVNALAQAGDAARGATLTSRWNRAVITARRPPAPMRDHRAGIARVVAALEDPFPQVAGQGAAQTARRGHPHRLRRLRESGPTSKRPLPEVARHRPAVCPCQVGDVARWQESRPGPATPSGSATKHRAASCTNSAAEWTASSSASAPRSPTTRC